MTAGPTKRHTGDVEAEIRVGYRMAGIGFEVGSEVAAGAILGWLTDRWLDTEPTGLLVGSIIGIVVALWTLIQRTLKLNRLLDRRHPTAHRGRPIPYDDDDDDDNDKDDGGDAREP